ncbi:MAG TPA: dihydrolipoamide acetyltransferase family protein [Rhabdochlamydiaceae bacterium]|jgi:2-oxoglutarate dehydrogenase E2 component (dihydrolipoamide succinyltransferase)
MSEDVKITLPKLGESILSATVVRWFKQIGEYIELDEPLLEVSTDKVNSEIPSPAAGVLKQIHAAVDQELKVGELLAIVSSGMNALSASLKEEVPRSFAQESQEAESTEMKDFFSPALLRLAREKGIGLDELERIPGTGTGGRITKRDLELYSQRRFAQPSSCPATAARKAVLPPLTNPIPGTEVERLKMTGMRKAIADNMTRSFYEAPHATLVTEVDVTSALRFIQQEKETFLAKHDCKLTITSFVARALVKALQEYPLINSSLEGDTILVKRFVNLGIAVSVDQGLMVPVIKNTQRLGLVEIAKAIGEMSQKAKSSRLTHDQVTEGTITMTNFGMSGVLIGVPIIRYPEVAIVGVGAIHKKVVPLEQDLLGVRSMMHISLTFDHRVLDGMYGCGFLGALKKHLEGEVEV